MNKRHVYYLVILLVMASLLSASILAGRIAFKMIYPKESPHVAITTSSTLTDAVIPGGCVLSDVSLRPNCGGGCCREGDTVSVTGILNGNAECSGAGAIQVNALGGDCVIGLSPASIQGITSDVSVSPPYNWVSGLWTIPSIPVQCLGKTVDAGSAALYKGDPLTGVKISVPPDPTGTGRITFCSDASAAIKPNATQSTTIQRSPTTSCNSKIIGLDSETLTPNTNWKTITGTLEQGSDSERFMVDVPLKGEYEFSLCGEEGGNAEYDSYLCLFSPTGSELAVNDDFCGLKSRITFTFASPGMYYIQVSGSGSSLGSYTLAYRMIPPTTTSSSTTTLSSLVTSCNGRLADEDAGFLYPEAGFRVADTLFLSSELDTHRFVVDANISGEYSFSLCPEDGGWADFDSFMCLFNGSGGLIQGNDDSCDLQSKIIYDLNSTGVYYLQVSGSEDKFGVYSLAYMVEHEVTTTSTTLFETTSTTSTSTTTTLPPIITSCGNRTSENDLATLTPTTSWQVTSTGTLLPDYVSDRFMVNATAPGEYLFSLCPGDGGSASYDSIICLMDGNGNIIAQNDVYCGLQSRINYTLNDIGLYYVQVSGYSDYYGSYALAYRRTPE